MPNIIEIHKINRVYGQGENSIRVLKDVSLDIKRGDFVAIIGQSGSGKSTLMNILGCLDKPTSGYYAIDGCDTKKLDLNALAKLRGEKIGFIFQRYNLMNTLSALENVSLPAIYAGISLFQRKKRAQQILEDLGLEGKTSNKPTELSGGQQQRVSIARALINGGEVILADEPTGALDSKSGLNVMQTLLDLHLKGHTIIVVTHDPNIASFAKRIIEIKDGEIQSDTRSGTVKTVETEILKKIRRTPFLYHRDQLFESFKMSIHAIYAHKLRSMLTMLGIIIGIASVISVVAIGQGSEAQILKNISRLGTNTIDIRPGKGFGDRTARTIKTLVVDDANILAKQSYIASVSPLSVVSGNVIYKNLSATASLVGAGADYFDVRGIEVGTGRLYSKEEVLRGEPVIVLSQLALNELFPGGENPIGKTLLFNKQPLTIIGITKKSARDNADNVNLFTPYSVVMNRITGARSISAIIVKIADHVPTVLAEKNLTDLLTSRHGTKDFYTVNLDSIRQNIQEASSTMTVLISSIAFISLVVGGIGVMNIMLVSVTERTKEIGIRMAIGARPYNILQQFLIEAVLICIIGGFIGIGLAYGIGAIMQKIAPHMPMVFSTNSVILAMTCSTIVGVLFGFMPARNAARLNPIDALSRE